MAHVMQVGIRLDEWHHDRLRRLAKASGMSRTATARLLLELSVQLAVNEQPPQKGLAAVLTAVRSHWPQSHAEEHE